MLFTPERIKRFWNKVIKTEDPEDCWEWNGARHPSGYGQIGFSTQGKNHGISAHRYSYMLHKGPIPEGFFVLHECDNRGCVNPSHLSVGAAANNSEDMVLRQRWRKGKPRQTAFSKLTQEELQDISTSKETCHALARKYKVAVEPIKRLRKGLTAPI